MSLFASLRPPGKCYLLQALGFGVSERKGACPQADLVEVIQFLRSLDKGLIHFSENLFSDHFGKLPIAPGTRVTGKRLTSCSLCLFPGKF